MGIEQTRKLYRHFFPAARWTLNLRGFRHIRRHGKAHSAEQLNPFRDGVHKLHLLVKMFVKQKMKLVEGRSSHLPMRFLVQIAEGHRVREQLIQLRRHFQSNRLFQFQWQQMVHGAVSLNFTCSLVQAWLRAVSAMIA